MIKNYAVLGLLVTALMVPTLTSGASEPGIQAESFATCSKTDGSCQGCAALKASLETERKQKSFRNAIDSGSQIGLHLTSGSSQEVQWAGSMVGGALGGLVHLSVGNPVGRAVVFAVPSAFVCGLAGGAIINQSAMPICAQLGLVMPALREMYVDLDPKRRDQFIATVIPSAVAGFIWRGSVLGLIPGSVSAYLIEKYIQRKEHKEQKMVQDLVEELACKN